MKINLTHDEVLTFIEYNYVFLHKKDNVITINGINFTSQKNFKNEEANWLINNVDQMISNKREQFVFEVCYLDTAMFLYRVELLSPKKNEYTLHLRMLLKNNDKKQIKELAMIGKEKENLDNIVLNKSSTVLKPTKL